MIQLIVIGKVCSKPRKTKDDRGSYCKVHVGLGANETVYVIAYGKSAEALVEGEKVLIAGEFSYYDGTKKDAKIEAGLVHNINSGDYSPAYAIASGGVSFIEKKENFTTFSIGSYDGKTKTYTNVGANTNHPLINYVQNKRRVIAAGWFKTLLTKNKKHILSLNARTMEITDKNSDTNGVVNKPTVIEEKIDSVSQLDDMPW